MRQIGPVLEERLKLHNQTKQNNADPNVSIQVTRARSAVMDSTYWTVETIRTKAGVGDVAVAARRQRPYGRPDRLYEIHVDNGVVKTTLREYPDYQKDGWQPQFDLGPGSSVAIAFDGEWKLWRDKWRFQSGEKPWLFWTDSAQTLWAQHWDDAATKQELATNVVEVAALRAWKNAVLRDSDQGIVAAYIKTDGYVHYRNRAEQLNGDVVWEAERQLSDFTGVAEDVNLFLTNDYRMGFVVQDDQDDVHWYVTPRNWGGMASPAEQLSAGFRDITFTVTPIAYHDTFETERIDAGITDIWFNVAEPIYPEPIFAENPEGSEVQLLLRFNHAVDHDLTQVGPAFTITDSLGAEFTIVSTESGVDNTEILFNMNNFAGASGNMFIDYDRSVIPLHSMNQGSTFDIESFSIEFDPDLAPPEGHAVEHIGASIVDVTFTVTPIAYTNMYGTENITAGVTDIVFTVTKVGSNPL
jgi:hypothetical protein